jgi:uncharacterized protein YbaP (TraB family)
MSIFASCFNQSSTKEKTGYLLWKISGKDLAKPSYLLGTLHLESGDYLDSIPGVRNALKNCEQVIGEINSSDMLEAQMQLQQQMMMPEDTTYAMLYSDEDYNFVDGQLKTLLRVGLEQLGRYKPGALSLMYAQMIYMQLFPNFSPLNSMDLVVQQEAIKSDKPVNGLESGMFQANLLLNSDNLKMQAEKLLCVLKNHEYVKTQAEMLVKEYRNCNLDKLYSYLDDNTNPCPMTPDEVNAFVKNRNEAWMQKLPEMIREKSSFVAVGALHLGGEIGLLSQFEKAGYTVQAVTK